MSILGIKTQTHIKLIVQVVLYCFLFGYLAATAFVTREGLFECLVTPFGVTNAVATFLVNTALHGLFDVCVVYWTTGVRPHVVPAAYLAKGTVPLYRTSQRLSSIY